MKDLIQSPSDTPEISLGHIPSQDIPFLAQSVKMFLDFTGAATNRATHYNSIEEQQEAERAIHKTIFDVDRSIYGLLMLLPGITDHSKMRACTALLGNKSNGQDTLLPFDREKEIISRLVDSLPPQRSLKMFNEFKKKRINNTRTRKQILKFILNSPNLEYWSVKYRKKLRDVLVHCWGERKAGIIKNMLSDAMNSSIEEDWSDKEINILQKCSLWPAQGSLLIIISFILGNTPTLSDNTPGLDLIKAFNKSKSDISKGNKLPIEVLEGIRSTYHKDTTQKELLEIAKDSLTKTQKKQVQKKAQKEGVQIEFNPFRHSISELYIYAYEMGMSREIRKAIDTKAKKAAETLPFRFNSVGILVDDSHSMSGSDQQKLRPMAMALAMKDILKNTAPVYENIYVNENSSVGTPRPKGGTDLANGMLTLLEMGVDVVFILSDGYENSPSGRLAEVLRLVRKTGNKTPVYHINPVVASESRGLVKQLSDDIPAMSISKPEQLGMIMLKSMLDNDPEKGIKGLLGMAIPLLENRRLT
jgi:hypothetical protein